MNKEEKLLKLPEEYQPFFDSLDYEIDVAEDIRWPLGETITIAFEEVEDSEKLFFYGCLKIWESYINVKFVVIDEWEKAMIRVGFSPLESWSYVGKEALTVPKKNKTVAVGWEGIELRLDLIGKILGYPNNFKK